ncbi:MAG TPA: YfhO family protein [Puia sp.]|uniref:YfhO family protein n=1 Tax=Puia sp. TaxID=2045100 RepID=UPI002D11ED3F|nr:YfhO family protein [Puia sp.]HVU97608.1 YfhO family protein [Puia sp.]
MKKFSQDLLRSAIPHFIAIIVFAVVAYVYCRPAFENKVLEQEDVLQWQAMAHNSFKYKEKHGHFPLWSNGMFSGMPAYQIAMDSQSVNIPNLFYGLLTLFLVKPASFFFLACLCFYFLAGVLRVKPFVAIIGALAYAYGTYNAVIISVGHDTKMQSIALMPGVIGALILICERKYWLGMVLTSLFTALMVSFNHIQIVYYTMIIAGGLLLGYGIPWLRRGEGRLLVRTLLLVLGASLIGILSNAVNLFTSYDSSKESIRGGSELADAKSNYTKDGLSEHAAFDFSMYKTEPFVLFIPDIYGGSSDLQLPANRSQATRVYQKMPRTLADQVGMEGPKYYWGGVGVLFSGPPYIGAVIILLALTGFFLLDNRHKWWILAVTLLTIVMSWGGYFQGFNSFLLKYLPMYNKFRAPSMILVVPSFLLCVMATLTLQQLAAAEHRERLWRRYGKGLLLIAGIFGILILFYFRFNYSSPNDVELMIKARSFGKPGMKMMASFIEGLQADRRHLFAESILRSGIIVLMAAGLIAIYIRKKFPAAIFLALLGVLAFADLISIDLKYLNDDNYKEREAYELNFAGTRADSTILADKGYYRVFDIRDSVANALTYGAMTAYFHQSIGGYHAARLKIYEDLINRQLYNYPNCSPVLDMLNAKYIIRAVRGGGDTVILNKDNLGPVWFADSIRFEPTAKEVMDDLTWFDPKHAAILFSADSAKVIPPDTARTKTDTAMITLVSNDNDEASYLAQSNHRQFAVFSEVFYKRGWRAWIDDKEVPIIRTNYVLRGISVPAGRHVIRFFFRPLSYYLGRQIQWMASIIFLLMVAGAIIVGLREYPFPFRKVVSSAEKCEPLSSAYPMPQSPLKE